MLLATLFVLSQTLHLERLPMTPARPVDAKFAPWTDKYLYIIESAGKVRVAVNGVMKEKPFLDIDAIVPTPQQAGLLSIALAPDFKRSKTFYVAYCDLAYDLVVARYQAKKFTKAKRGSGQIIFRSNGLINDDHDGGTLMFGPDGKLYLSVGDGGDMARSQDLTSERGKILTIDPETGDWEVAHYGLRNPWRYSFDRETGDIWIGDVGEVTFEEVDYAPAGSGVLNFGWPMREGTFLCPTCDDGDTTDIVYPVKYYHHTNPFTGITGICVIGGYVYRGEALPWLQGQYVWADFIGRLWSRAPDGTITDLLELATADANYTAPVAFVEDNAGELYVIDMAGGDLFKLVPGQ